MESGQKLELSVDAVLPLLVVAKTSWLNPSRGLKQTNSKAEIINGLAQFTDAADIPRNHAGADGRDDWWDRDGRVWLNHLCAQVCPMSSMFTMVSDKRAVER